MSKQLEAYRDHYKLTGLSTAALEGARSFDLYLDSHERQHTRELQRMLGVEQDGWVGPKTVKEAGIKAIAYRLATDEVAILRARLEERRESSALTPFALAQRYIGIAELSKQGEDHPLIQWWGSLCGGGLNVTDEVAWCSSFVNGIAWELRLPRSKSMRARSWLQVGTPIDLIDAKVGYDVVILQRGEGEQPGASVIDAPGHVGFYAGVESDYVLTLGGNQSNQVSIARQGVERVLGVRRLG